MAALRELLADARKLGEQLSPADRARLNALCNELDRLASQLADLGKSLAHILSKSFRAARAPFVERRGLGNTPEANGLRRTLHDKLRELSSLTQKALTERVVDDFADITSPLKAFVDAVYAPPNQAGREQNFDHRAANLNDASTRAAHTGLIVGRHESAESRKAGRRAQICIFSARCGPCKNKKTIEALIDTANKVSDARKSFVFAANVRNAAATHSQVHQMTPQVINAGKIRLHNSSADVDQHFDNLRREYADALNRLREHVDNAIDTGDFVRASESAMRRRTEHCEDSIRDNQPQGM